MIIEYIKLKNLVIKSLIAHGVKLQDAKITAKVLLEGDLRGYINHGVDRLLQIKDGLDKGTINPHRRYDVIKENISTAVIDACHTLGQPVGDYAMRLAIQKAQASGIGMVGVLNAAHLGILSYYSELACESLCLGIAMTTSSPAVILKGGKIKTLGTNPISYSIPFSPFHFTADFSTSKVSRGTILQYLRENKKIPKDWAVDINGDRTNAPEDALKGGIQTIDGDIKGSLLSMLISIMAGHMIGGVTNPEVCGTRYMDEHSNKGDLFIAIHIPSFTNLESFYDQTVKLCDFISNQNIDFRIPGQGSYERRLNAIENGIEINDELMALLDESFVKDGICL